jgi:hypothetical protein
MPAPSSAHLFLIRAASLLVPGNVRPEWRREWEAELWHVHTSLLEREAPAGPARSTLRQFVRGAFVDGALYRLSLLDSEALLRDLRDRLQSPALCLALLAGAIGLAALLSGLLPVTRSLLLPLPYEEAPSVATVSQSNLASAVRSGVPRNWVRLWQSRSRLLLGAASYVWREDASMDGSNRLLSVLDARVSDTFFSVLGVHSERGRVFQPGDAEACYNCVVLSHQYAKETHAAPGSSITLNGARYRVIGVMDSGFWFLSRSVAMWSIATRQEWSGSTRTAVVVRLAPGVSATAAAAELESILQAADIPAWNSLLDVSLVQERVRSVFGSFALALALAIVITVVAFGLRLPAMDRRVLRHARIERVIGALFFLAKAILLLAAVLIAGLEFTHAPAITMTGGTDLLTEPASTWLFLIACMGVLSWSIHDQRRRCRVCLRRLGLAAHVGCPGCLLLEWAGTELVCSEGHGMLHIPEMLSCWRESEQWTALDESWVDLFER